MLKSHFEISRALRPPTYAMHSSHSHSYYELYYLSQGGCTLLVRNKLYTIKPGTVVFIQKDTLHKTTYTGNAVCERVFIEFTSDYLDDFKDNDYWVASNLSDKIMYINQDMRPIIEGLIDSILLDHNSNELYSDVIKKCHFKELVVTLLRHCDNAPEVVINKISAVSDALICDAINYVSAHFNEAISLASMADKFHLNPSYFSKKFKDVCGVGFKEYLNHVRINHSEQLLLETKKSITEIAFECGYDNSNYFGDAFRHINGISPSEFRKQKGSFSV